MLQRKFVSALGGAVLAFAIVERADAAFHLVQIEQVIGGVNGDVTAQAIQIRMRSPGQHFMDAGRLRVRDATGANPITLWDPATDLTGPSQTGDRVLVATASFLATTSPSTDADYPMTAVIPPSYFAAGSLTFEDEFNTIFWRLSWGGAGYTGSTAGNPTNGTFPSPWPGSLPADRCFALQFTGTATDASTSNSAQYALTTGASAWTNYEDEVHTISTCIPTVSQWGLLALVLLIASAGSVVAVRGRSMA